MVIYSPIQPGKSCRHISIQYFWSHTLLQHPVSPQFSNSMTHLAPIQYIYTKQFPHYFKIYFFFPITIFMFLFFLKNFCFPICCFPFKIQYIIILFFIIIIIWQFNFMIYNYFKILCFVVLRSTFVYIYILFLKHSKCEQEIILLLTNLQYKFCILCILIQIKFKYLITN